MIKYWFPDNKFRKIDTTSITDSAYEKELLYDLPITVTALTYTENHSNGAYGQTLEKLQHFDIMTRIDLTYLTFIFCILYSPTQNTCLSGYQKMHIIPVNSSFQTHF